MDFLERFMGVVERLSDLGVDVLATVARCNKIQVDADKKTWLGASGRESSARENKLTESNLPSSAHCQFPTHNVSSAARHVMFTVRVEEYQLLNTCLTEVENCLNLIKC